MTMHTRYRAAMQRALGQAAGEAAFGEHFDPSKASGLGATVLLALEIDHRFTLTALPVDERPTEPTEADPVNLDGLRRLAEAATPGPWEIDRQQPTNVDAPHPGGRMFGVRTVAQCVHGWTPGGGPANAELVAAMRNALPDLLARADEARGVRAVLHEAQREIVRLRALVGGRPAVGERCTCGHTLASHSYWSKEDEHLTCNVGDCGCEGYAVGGRPAAPTRDEIHDAIADALSEHVWAHGTGEIDGDGINEAAQAVVALLSRSAAEPPRVDDLLTRDERAALDALPPSRAYQERAQADPPRCKRCRGYGAIDILPTSEMSAEALDSGALVEGTRCPDCNGSGVAAEPKEHGDGR